MDFKFITFCIVVFGFAALGFLRAAHYRDLLARALHADKRNKLAFLDLSRGNAEQALQNKSLIEPERLWTYSYLYFEKFLRQLGSGDPKNIALYTGPVLRGWDLLFAVSAALLSFVTDLYLSQELKHFFTDPNVALIVERLFLFAAAMSLVYGSADLAEDFKLASLITAATPPRYEVERSQVAAANMLTRLKLVSISLSLVAGLVFTTLHFLHTLFKPADIDHQQALPVVSSNSEAT